jgi:hypothetical protein
VAPKRILFSACLGPNLPKQGFLRQKRPIYWPLPEVAHTIGLRPTRSVIELPCCPRNSLCPRVVQSIDRGLVQHRPRLARMSKARWHKLLWASMSIVCMVDTFVTERCSRRSAWHSLAALRRPTLSVTSIDQRRSEPFSSPCRNRTLRENADCSPQFGVPRA